MRLWKPASIGVLAFFVGLSACSGMKQDLEDCARTRATVMAELGVDSSVTIRTMNGRTSVAVRLASVPSGDAAATKARVTDIVTRTFRSKVNHVDLAF